MGKLSEILRLGKAPGMNTNAPSERDPDRTVPKAFKSLSGNDVKKFVRESGFSVDHVKRVWNMIALGTLFLVLPAARGADINRGYAFTATDRVTSTKLNNLVDLATINATFFSDKASSAPVSSDNFMFWRSGVLYRTPFSSMTLNHPALITGQVEDTTPALDDYLLTYDTSAAGLKKSQLVSTIFTNAALIASRTLNSAPSVTTDWVLVWNSGTGAFTRVNRTNYVRDMFSIVKWTNLTAMAVSDPDANTWPIWDAAVAENKQVSLSGIVSLSPILTTNNSSSYALIVSNGIVSRITMANLGASVVAGTVPTKFVSSAVGIAGPGNLIDTAHNLAGTPQSVRAVLVCQTAEAGYSINDEIDIPGTGTLTYGGIIFTWGANSTNVFITKNNTYTLSSFNKSTAAGFNLTLANWKAKIYAQYFP